MQDPFPYGESSMKFHSPTGCVATAMAGLLHYYRYPIYGTGHINYQPTHVVRDGDNNPIDTIIYPVQDQDLNTEHNYEMMPNAINEHTGEVAELMWHAGLSIEIMYGPTSTSGYSAEAVNAFKEKWGYNPEARYVSRSSYNAANWSSLLHDELNAHRIIFYSARETSDPTVGHAFLLDGYQDFNNVNETVSYSDTIVTFSHIDTIITYEYDTITADSVTLVSYDSVFTVSHTDSLVTMDTVFSHTMMHVNWGWGGYVNGWFTFENSHVEGWSEQESAAIQLFPAGNPEEPTEGQIRVCGTRGTISDGSGCRLYSPNTDRSWMVSAPESSRYSFTFKRLETEANADEVIFYKNGNLSQEVGRYSGHTLPSTLTINADSVMIRFISNDNDIVDYGFVMDFVATTHAAYCGTEIALQGSGTITDKGNVSTADSTPYRPDSYCSWKIVGCDRVYFSYPQLDLADGDYIEFYDFTYPNKNRLLKRISLIDWPAEDVFIAEGHKIRIVFVSDNYLENNGFELTYETVTDIHNYAEVESLNIYPNPASSTLNVHMKTENEGSHLLRISDLSGKTLALENISSQNGEIQTTFNVSNLSKGLYLLSIENAAGKTVRKFIVE